MLTAPPTPVVILLFSEPETGAHGCGKAFRPTQPQMTRKKAMHNLAGVENNRLATRLSVVSGKRAIAMLNTEKPVDHAMRTADQIGAFKSVSGFDKGLDSVAGCLRVAR